VHQRPGVRGVHEPADQALPVLGPRLPATGAPGTIPPRSARATTVAEPPAGARPVRRCREETRMKHEEIVAWLREADDGRLAELWRAADQRRRECVGDVVHLRGLVEISSHCARFCAYCGLRAPNGSLTRYRLTMDEVMVCVHNAVRMDCGTVVLQAGEDPALEARWVAELIRRIRSEANAAVTLSLGEREVEELACWKEAGADRYLLRFETSNRDLYERIHPSRPGQVHADRVSLLRQLRELGYEVGSGVMVGIPGQTVHDLARDIALFGELDLDMIGSGPFIPHPDTPLGALRRGQAGEVAEQVAADELTTYKVMALTRLTCPWSNIPATTALAALNARQGRALGLCRGANVIMPNFTTAELRSRYEIYPDKSTGHLYEHPDDLKRMIRGLGRLTAAGRGDSPAFQRRQGGAAKL